MAPKQAPRPSAGSLQAALLNWRLRRNRQRERSRSRDERVQVVHDSSDADDDASSDHTSEAHDAILLSQIPVADDDASDSRDASGEADDDASHDSGEDDADDHASDEDGANADE